MLLLLLSSLAFACILTGALAGRVVFTLLIVVEHFTTVGAWSDGGRVAYVPADAFLVVSQRSAWRLVAVQPQPVRCSSASAWGFSWPDTRRLRTNQTAQAVGAASRAG